MVVSDHFVLCKAALIFAVTRCLLSFLHNLVKNMGLFSLFLDPLSSSSSPPSPSPCHSSSCTLKMVKENLTLATFGNIEHRLPENHDMSCAVCLNRLRKRSQVWELGNCCHVFHKHCLEKWLVYDHRLTCPLCRASLIAATPLPQAPPQQPPSWAVERMLYLFGDDLLP